MTDFTTIVSNTLEEVQMISGDERLFYYDVYDDTGEPIDLTYMTPSIMVFKYGDPTHIFYYTTGSLILTGDKNRFVVGFNGRSQGQAMSGVFQQQVVIVDGDGGVHVPAQGKIVIFPSNPDYP